MVRRKMRPSGRLVSVGSRFVVELKSSEHPVRQRFTLAHEVAHVLVARLERHEGEPIGRLLRCQRDSALERICDLLASRMLLPPVDLNRALSTAPLTLERLAGIARRFRVSWQALTISVTGLRKTHSFVGWRFEDRPGSSRRAYRVAWAATPTGVFVPTYDSCDPDCIVEACSASGRQIGTVTLNLGSLRGLHEVEAIPHRRHSRGRPDVLMLIRNEGIRTSLRTSPLGTRNWNSTNGSVPAFSNSPTPLGTSPPSPVT